MLTPQKTHAEYEDLLTGRTFIRSDNKDLYRFIERTPHISGISYNVIIKTPPENTKWKVAEDPRVTLYEFIQKDGKTKFTLGQPARTIEYDVIAFTAMEDAHYEFIITAGGEKITFREKAE